VEGHSAIRKKQGSKNEFAWRRWPKLYLEGLRQFLLKDTERDQSRANPVVHVVDAWHRRQIPALLNLTSTTKLAD
jgi:hypothetical protein